MGIEIERKFLVRGVVWKSLAAGELFRQGYLSADPERTVRVRLVGNDGFLTIKGKSQGMRRVEFEYAIPGMEAQALLDLCQRPLIEKYRYRIPSHGLVWEVDEFLGENAGLVVAEVELVAEEQAVELPDWVGDEVTGDPRYFNSNLMQHPYSSW